jgi:hypothetical protein
MEQQRLHALVRMVSRFGAFQPLKNVYNFLPRNKSLSLLESQGCSLYHFISALLSKWGTYPISALITYYNTGFYIYVILFYTPSYTNDDFISTLVRWENYIIIFIAFFLKGKCDKISNAWLVVSKPFRRHRPHRSFLFRPHGKYYYCELNFVVYNDHIHRCCVAYLIPRIYSCCPLPSQFNFRLWSFC